MSFIDAAKIFLDSERTLIKFHERIPSPAPAPLYPCLLSSPMVDRAKRYIDEHFDKIRTVQDVAAAMKCPYHSLRKAFANEIGMSMQEYLHRVRVREAKALVRKRTLKLYAVARLVGYSSDNPLRWHWKKFFGRCPIKR